jgi:hypothetical protein
MPPYISAVRRHTARPGRRHSARTPGRQAAAMQTTTTRSTVPP